MDDLPAATRARGRAVRRTDPDRRNRIIAACLEVIAESGVEGVSHRKVAAVADVPLGSMTYHFEGMHELLFEAFARHGSLISERFEHLFAAAGDADAARLAIADFIADSVNGDRRDLVLSHELYTLAARDSRYREITIAWMLRSRAVLEEYFDPETCRVVDALIEGLTIHCSLDRQPCPRETILKAIVRATQ